MPLVLGNHKLGNNIHHWSLRSGPDCPGKTELCSSFCYAKRGSFQHKNVQQAHMVNRAFSDSPHFVSWLSLEMARHNVKTLRVHADGDFYNSTYTKRWLKIFQDNPHIVFYFYTRSWRCSTMRPLFEEMAKLKNVSVWYSIDRDTGWPGAKHKRVKLAYMQVAEDDLPAKKVDLVFRVHHLRKSVAKRVLDQNGSPSIVCPPENGVTKTQCDKCKLCYRQAVPSELSVAERKRIPLSLVAAG